MSKRIKQKVIVKYDNGEKYVFRNKDAIVPGYFCKGQPVKISLKDFLEWTKKD